MGKRSDFVLTQGLLAPKFVYLYRIEMVPTSVKVFVKIRLRIEALTLGTQSEKADSTSPCFYDLGARTTIQTRKEEGKKR